MEVDSSCSERKWPFGKKGLLLKILLKAIHFNLCDKRSVAFFKTYRTGTNKKAALGYIAESISYFKC